MARQARIVIPNVPHHITQRGVRKHIIFECDDDMKIYISLLKKFSEKHELKIIAYCLMPNHIHIVAVPNDDFSIAKTIRDAHSKYANYFNTKKDATGHLFQYRFFSCPMDNKYMLNAIRYVERNPVEAGMVKKAADYRWSSAVAHQGVQNDDILDKKLTKDLHQQISKEDWEEWLSNHDMNITRDIQKHLAAGIPVGDKKFLKQLRKKFGVQTELRKPGRPKLKS